MILNNKDQTLGHYKYKSTCLSSVDNAMSCRGPFIKDVINRGGGGFAKRLSYLISLFAKNDDKWRGVKKSQKIDV